MKSRILILSLLLSMIPMPVLAKDDPQLKVYHKDKTLELDGLTGEDNAFLAYIELTAKGGDIDKFRFVSHGLTQKGAPEIAPSRIRLLGAQLLRNGHTRPFPVAVNDVVEEPGIYKGKAEIQPRGQAQFKPVDINLKLTAKEVPNVALEPEEFLLGLNLVACKEWVFLGFDFGRLNCRLARWLLADRGFQAKYPLTLRNNGLNRVQITDTDLIVTDEQGSKRWTNEELSLRKKKVLSAQHTETMWLTFHRDAMSPGHYTGYISMTIKDGLDPLPVPVDVRVRTGPFWAIVALVVGVGLGLFGNLFGGGNTGSDQGRSEGGGGNNRGRENDTTGPNPGLIATSGGSGFRWKKWLRIGTIKVAAYIGAVLVGLAVIYAGEQGTTFGANGLADLLAIGAWGFAADLSSRGLIRHLGKS